MAGIGSQEFPEMTLSEAVEIAERVGRENVKTKSGLLEVMGLKRENGYFYHKVSALTKYYGVLDRSLSNVSLTPLGERIAHPLSDEDKRAAIAEAAGRVPLLKSLFDSLGRNFHDADFRTKLRDVTQAPLPAIQKEAPYLEKLYRDAVPYMSERGPPPRDAPQAPADGGSDARLPASTLPMGSPSQHPLPQARYEAGFRTFEGDGVYLKVKRDPEALNEALVTIQGWLTLHEAKTKHSAPPKGQEGDA